MVKGKLLYEMAAVILLLLLPGTEPGFPHRRGQWKISNVGGGPTQELRAFCVDNVRNIGVILAKRFARGGRGHGPNTPPGSVTGPYSPRPPPELRTTRPTQPELRAILGGLDTTSSREATG